MSRRAIFLDKDGTLVEDVPYNVDPRRIRVYPEVFSALKAIAAQGYKLMVVSNQGGIAQGYFDRAAVERVGQALGDELARRGVKIEGFYYCPHHPDGAVEEFAVHCDCRKPRAGLLQRAAREHDIDLSESWMVGDILNDVEAGNRAGCRSILVDRGNETEWKTGRWRTPTFTLPDLAQLPTVVSRADVASLHGEQ